MSAVGGADGYAVYLAQNVVVILDDFGLYDFCFICTKTPNKLTVYAKDEESGEQTEKEISISEKLPALEKGKTYMLTVKAEWTETENRDYFGTVSYVFKVKTTE